MRRLFVLTALVVAACSKQDKPAADSPAAAPPAPLPPPALTSADVGGTWDAQGMPMDKDTVVVTFTMNLTDTGAGTSIAFPSGVKVVSTKRQVDGDSMVMETGGFKSQVRSGQQVTSTRAVYRLRDGKLTGTLRGTYANGDTANYRITATKKP